MDSMQTYSEERNTLDEIRTSLNVVNFQLFNWKLKKDCASFKVSVGKVESMFKFKLNTKGNSSIGYLVPLEVNCNLSFQAKRVFYIYGVPPNNIRASHAYHNTEQVLICLSGNLKIKCFDGIDENIYELNSPDEAIYISPKVWRTTFEHSSDAVLLVLSSLEYNELDYIRDYNEFLEVVKCT